MREAYTEDEHQRGYPEGIERHFWHRSRNDALRRALSDWVSPGALILDVGCGMAVATRYLREQGFDCRGVEPGQAPPPADMAEWVCTGSEVSELPRELREQVQVVMLLDVLEHMDDRVSFLAELQEQLPNCLQFGNCSWSSARKATRSSMCSSTSSSITTCTCSRSSRGKPGTSWLVVTHSTISGGGGACPGSTPRQSKPCSRR